MKREQIFIRGIFLLLVGIALIAMTNPAQASFVIDTNPGGEAFFIIGANKNVSAFSGSVAVNSNTSDVDVQTVGAVNTGNGYANIKPSKKTNTLTELTFTPAVGNRYGDFSFRGQLETAGTVYVKVFDQNGLEYDFDFYVGTTEDFDRIGVMSTAGEWIQSVELSNTAGFKEVKQIEFTAVPIPGAVWLLGTGLLGLIGIRRRRNK